MERYLSLKFGVNFEEFMGTFVQDERKKLEDIIKAKYPEYMKYPAFIDFLCEMLKKAGPVGSKEVIQKLERQDQKIPYLWMNFQEQSKNKTAFLY